MSGYEQALKSVQKKTGRKRTTLPAKRKAKVGTDGQPATTGERSRVGAKKPTATRASPKGKPVARLTNVWPDSKGRDVPVKATVKFEGMAWTVKGRFTSRTKEGKLVPSLALAPKAGKGKGRHAPAKAVTPARP
jgi:hypothetical protein